MVISSGLIMNRFPCPSSAENRSSASVVVTGVVLRDDAGTAGHAALLRLRPLLGRVVYAVVLADRLGDRSPDVLDMSSQAALRVGSAAHLQADRIQAASLGYREVQPDALLLDDPLDLDL